MFKQVKNKKLVYLIVALIPISTNSLASDYKAPQKSSNETPTESTDKPHLTIIQKEEVRRLPVTKGKLYVKFNVGTSIPSKLTDNFKNFPKPKTSTLYEIAGGYEYNKFAIELAFNQVQKHKLIYQDSKAMPSFNKVTLTDETKNVKYMHNYAIQHSTIFLNGYYSLFKYEIVRPYIGMGIGLSRNKLSNIIISNDSKNANGNVEPPKMRQGKTTNNFAWQVMAGTTIEVAKNLNLNFEYRYARLGNAKTNTHTTQHIKGKSVQMQNIREKTKLVTHGFLIGIQYKFT